jgi:eukaryotic-like serine/threonine-protein kinase
MTLEAGTRVGKYEIKQLLGAGGMGEVYLAQDAELGRAAALKILPGDVARDRQRMSRFTQEARAASALNHPNILTIYDVGHEGPLHFIAAEFIEGETLRQYMKERRPKAGAVLDVAAQVADALAAAHEAGIVHRDIKPENVMVRRRDGYVKVVDFGLAKLARAQLATVDTEAPTEARDVTEPGMLIGTVPYMSPEQLRGEPLDARTDIFSFGVLVYELASRRHPFQRDSFVETLAAIITHEPPFGEDLADAPEGLREVLRRCLEKDRERRYSDACELLEDLRRLRQGRRGLASNGDGPGSDEGSATQGVAAADTVRQHGKTEAHEAARTDDVPHVSGKMLGGAYVLALVLAVLAGGGGGLIYEWVTGGISRLWLTPTAAQEVSRTTQVTVWPGLDDYPSISPDGNSIAYCSDHEGGFEIYVKSLAPGAKEVRLTQDGGLNFQPAWSPDGRQVVFHSKSRGGIWVAPASGGEARQLTEFGSAPAWSPDGKLVAFQSNPLVDLGATGRNAIPPSTLWLVPSAGGEPRQLTEVGRPAGGHGAPSFSPDGRRVAFEADEYNKASVWTVSVEGGNAKRVSPQDGYAPIYTPDGRSIIFIWGGVFRVPISEAGERLGEPTSISGIGAGNTFVRRISLSADGRRMAYTLLSRIESISSVLLRPGSFEAAGPPSVIVSNASTRNNFPAFSPDGRRLAYSSCNMTGTTCDLWLANADGTGQTQLTTAESSELMPAWFADMTQLGFITDRTGHFTYWAINLDTRRERMLFDFGPGPDYMRLSPDGRSLTFNRKDADGRINLWVATPANGGQPRPLTSDRELMGFPAWSPDGRSLAFQMKRGDDTHLMVMPSEGGPAEQLTNEHGQSWLYSWSPDGDKILYAGFREGLWNVWWVSRTTGQQRRLTDYKKLNSFVRYPAWSPKGDRIAYEYSETSGNVWIADLK